MKRKLPIILTALVVVVAVGVFVACSGSKTPTVENPPAQSSTPEIKTEPSLEPTPEATPSAPEKVEPSPEPSMEPEKEPVVTDPPKANETPEPSVEPDPVVTPEPTPEVTPTPEPEKVVEKTEPEKKPEPTPVPDDTQRPTGPDESNKQEEQAQKEAQQSASSKFTYPANSTTSGLTSFQINSGMYINKNDGKIYDQYGDCYGTAPGYENSTYEGGEEAIKNNKENADKIYDGDGSGSDTSGWGSIQQSASSKFTYPANSTTEGLNSFYISSGCYINKNDGKIYDQDGNCYGTAPGYGGHTATAEEEEQAIKNTEENAKDIYNGDGSGSDTSGWGN